jgi:hypothetical protein
MATSQARYFTLAQARAALPEVKQRMADIQAARVEILRLRPEALPAIEKAATNGGCKEAGELFVHGKRIEENAKAILAMGIVIKDLERGLIDFLGTRNGREIYLCWHYGEDDIAFWHELSTGFAGRRPLDEQIS